MGAPPPQELGWCSNPTGGPGEFYWDGEEWIDPPRSAMKAGNPLALGLVIVGAVAMALAAFLPLNEPTGPFRLVQNNTLNPAWRLATDRGRARNCR